MAAVDARDARGNTVPGADRGVFGAYGLGFRV